MNIVSKSMAAAVGLAALAAFVPSPMAAAQSGPSAMQVKEGRAIADAWCMRCHVIGRENQSSALVGAPSFVALAQDGFDEGRLAYALLDPHPVMPKFELSRDDVRALAAYIGSLTD